MNRTASPSALTFRTAAQPRDVETIRSIAASTGFFSHEELEIARELIEDRLERGEASEYHFLFADRDDQTVAFASYGRIPCTQSSVDLYWIAVRDDHRGLGVGSALLGECERLIARMGGRRIYVETSSRAQYEPTIRFYGRCGYHIEATLHDYYAPGDGLIILLKVLKSA
jgi:D-alanine-D-alanine ligase